MQRTTRRTVRRTAPQYALGLALLSAWALLGAPSAEAAEPTVRRFVACADVADKECVGEGRRFAVDAGTLWAYAVIENRGEPLPIEMVWRRDGKEIVTAELNVGRSRRWRTWSRKRLRRGDAGGWTVALQRADQPHAPPLAVLAFAVGDRPIPAAEVPAPPSEDAPPAAPKPATPKPAPPAPPETAAPKPATPKPAPPEAAAPKPAAPKPPTPKPTPPEAAAPKPAAPKPAAPKPAAPKPAAPKPAAPKPAAPKPAAPPAAPAERPSTVDAPSPITTPPAPETPPAAPATAQVPPPEPPAPPPAPAKPSTPAETPPPGPPAAPSAPAEAPSTPAPAPPKPVTPAPAPVASTAPSADTLCRAWANIRRDGADGPIYQTLDVRIGPRTTAEAAPGLVVATPDTLWALASVPRAVRETGPGGVIDRRWDMLMGRDLTTGAKRVWAGFPATMAPPEKGESPRFEQTHRLVVQAVLGPYVGLTAHLHRAGPRGAQTRARALTTTAPGLPAPKAIAGPALQAAFAALPPDRRPDGANVDVGRFTLMEVDGRAMARAFAPCCGRFKGEPVSVDVPADPAALAPGVDTGWRFVGGDGCAVYALGGRVHAGRGGAEAAVGPKGAVLLGVTWVPVNHPHRAAAQQRAVQTLR